jgi:hypothetical protein
MKRRLYLAALFLVGVAVCLFLAWVVGRWV